MQIPVFKWINIRYIGNKCAKIADNLCIFLCMKYKFDMPTHGTAVACTMFIIINSYLYEMHNAYADTEHRNLLATLDVLLCLTGVPIFLRFIHATTLN